MDFVEFTRGLAAVKSTEYGSKLNLHSLSEVNSAFSDHQVNADECKMLYKSFSGLEKMAMRFIRRDAKTRHAAEGELLSVDVRLDRIARVESRSVHIWTAAEIDYVNKITRGFRWRSAFWGAVSAIICYIGEQWVKWYVKENAAMISASAPITLAESNGSMWWLNGTNDTMRWSNSSCQPANASHRSWPETNLSAPLALNASWPLQVTPPRSPPFSPPCSPLCSPPC